MKPLDISSKIALAIVIAIASASRADASGTCGPFGNPPATIFASPTPICAGGARLGPWPDSDGSDRFACTWAPASASAAHPLPMLVFLHPSLTSADIVPISTNLAWSLGSANLSGDSARLGFILLAPEGRKTSHFYAPPDEKGYGWDNWYRQLDPAGDVMVGATRYRENVDAAAIDHFIAAEVATGKVDPNRIYLSGWSNGAAMAILYAVNRPNIAAAAVYSAPNPFQAFKDPCPQKPVAGAPADGRELRIANPRAAIYHVHNDCDIAGLCPNGELLKDQLASAGVIVTDQLISFLLFPATECSPACGTNPNGDTSSLEANSLGLANHIRWPFSWTTSMFDFLREHPLTHH